MDEASWDMINLLERDKKLTRLDAYALASMVMDCRVTVPRGTGKGGALPRAQEHLGDGALREAGSMAAHLIAVALRIAAAGAGRDGARLERVAHG